MHSLQRSGSSVLDKNSWRRGQELRLAVARAQAPGLAFGSAQAGDRPRPTGNPRGAEGRLATAPPAGKKTLRQRKQPWALLVFPGLPARGSSGLAGPPRAVGGTHLTVQPWERRHPWGAGRGDDSHLLAMTLLGSAKRNFRREGVLKL